MNPYAAPASSMAPPIGTGMSDFERYYLNQTPQAGFWHYLTSRGLAGNTPWAKYGQNQYDSTYNRYQAQAANDPHQGFFDYLGQTTPDYEMDYRQQAPQTRGDFSSRFLTPKARFTNAG